MNTEHQTVVLNQPEHLGPMALGIVLNSLRIKGVVTDEQGTIITKAMDEVVNALTDGQRVDFFAATGEIVISEPGILADHEEDDIVLFDDTTESEKRV